MLSLKNLNELVIIPVRNCSIIYVYSNEIVSLNNIKPVAVEFL